jgi:hypothetical protein
MESNVEIEKEAEPSSFEKAKKHLTKHKGKYIVGGFIALSFGLGFHFGNKGNSRRHYSRLLKDGVSDAVREGIKDIVDSGMRDVVKDGMKSVVTEVITDVVPNVVRYNVSNSVDNAVRRAIKESAVTIVKEVAKVEPKPLTNKDVDGIQAIMDNLVDKHSGIKVMYDAAGNVYTVSK